MTWRSVIDGPGTFATKRRAMPSSGWMRMASTSGSTSDPASPTAPERATSWSWLSSACGTLLKWTLISVVRLASRLPARM